MGVIEMRGTNTWHEYAVIGVLFILEFQLVAFGLLLETLILLLFFWQLLSNDQDLLDVL